MQITTLILSQLLYNEDFTRKVFPYLKDEYFDNPIDQAIYRIIRQHVEKYNKRPNQEVLHIELDKAIGIPADTFKRCKELVESLVEGESQDIDWLTETTEKWCKNRAIYNGLVKSLAIAQGKDKKHDQGEIVRIMEDAIAVSFDSHIGHDYFEDFNERFEFYHKVENRLPFDIPILNEITKGGLPNKVLMLWMGGVGVGKTATMCHQAASYLLAGKNVLYITMEMYEEMIAQRIDANLLDTDLDALLELPKAIYDQKVKRVREKTPGKLVIKEYPTAGANVNHFRHLLHELRFKKKFKPDVIFIDYLNICSSARVKMSQHIGMYTYVQFITQELRGFAKECDVPVISATQLNRDGYVSSDPGMEHTAESFGTAATADLMLVMYVNEELASCNQLQIKQIKNRLGDINKNSKFIVGRDLNKMRLYNVENPSRIDTGGPIKPPEKSSITNVRKVFESFT